MGKEVSAMAFLDSVQEIMGSLDAAPRIAEMKRIARQANWKPGQPLPHKLAQQLTLVGKEITADFSAGSDVSRTINNISLFYNIMIQGPRASYRAYKKNPTKFIERVGLVTALYLLNWLNNKDEEWWVERDPSMNYLSQPIKIGNEVLNLPLNQEADQIAAGIVVLLDSIYRQDPSIAIEHVKVLTSAFKPSLPVPLKWWVEQEANRTFWNDKPIVPEYVENSALPEAEKVAGYETETAVKIGEILGISPARIQHTVRSFTGSAGMDLLSMSDAVVGIVKKEDSEKEVADIPVLGSLFNRGGPMGMRPMSVQKLYELREEARAVNISKKVEETDRQRELRLQLEDASKEVSAYLGARSAAQTTEKKRELTQLAVDASQRAIEMYENDKVFRNTQKRRTRAAEKMRERLQAETPTPSR
jgi:hypothetical protein